MSRNVIIGIVVAVIAVIIIIWVMNMQGAPTDTAAPAADAAATEGMAADAPAEGTGSQ